MAPPPPEFPVKLVLLIASLLLSILLMVWILARLRISGTGKLTPVKARRSKILALIIGALLLSSITALALYQPRKYGDFPQAVFVSLQLANSSVGVTLDDILITADDGHGGALETFRQPSHGRIGVDRVLIGEWVLINLTCNKAPVFWGSPKLSLMMYTAESGFVLSYRNSSGDFNNVELWSVRNNSNTTTYYFAGGAAWIHLKVTIDWVMEE